MFGLHVDHVEIPDDAQVGEEFLLRVRLVEIREEVINVTSFGAKEPQLVSGRRDGTLVWVATRAIDRR